MVPLLQPPLSLAETIFVSPLPHLDLAIPIQRFTSLIRILVSRFGIQLTLFNRIGFVLGFGRFNACEVIRFLGCRWMEQLKTIGRELAMGSSQGGFGQTKEFLDLVKSIGEARSKAEEDRIVMQEIETLKRRIVDPDIAKRKMKEYIMRLVYVEMLGHDASFGYIYAVKMTHDDNLLLKRTGYLAVTLFLNEDHDLIILIVNTIQKDLKSDNFLVVCAALNAVCKLINEETIPAVLPQVVELLNHPKEAVRKKAVMALHRFHQRSPSSVAHLVPNFRKVRHARLQDICRYILDGYHVYQIF